jgi:hypothetical protein
VDRWTNWRRLAERDYWFDYEFVYDGPACYELGISRPNHRNIRPIYVGETINEKQCLTRYARHGSHLSKIIEERLKRGFILYYRAVAFQTKEQAKAMQDNLLTQYDYDWNLQYP